MIFLYVCGLSGLVWFGSHGWASFSGWGHETEICKSDRVKFFSRRGGGGEIRMGSVFLMYS